MTKGEIVDEIVIDANLVLQWPHGMSLEPQVDDDGLDALGGIMYMPSDKLRKWTAMGKVLRSAVRCLPVYEASEAEINLTREF